MFAALLFIQYMCLETGFILNLSPSAFAAYTQIQTQQWRSANTFGHRAVLPLECYHGGLCEVISKISPKGNECRAGLLTGCISVSTGCVRRLSVSQRTQAALTIPYTVADDGVINAYWSDPAQDWPWSGSVLAVIQNSRVCGPSQLYCNQNPHSPISVQGITEITSE